MVELKPFEYEAELTRVERRLSNMWDDARAEWGDACGGPAEHEIFAQKILSAVRDELRATPPSHSTAPTVEVDERAAVAKAVEHAARICESLCVCDNGEDEEEINRILRNRAAQIRDLAGRASKPPAREAAERQSIDTPANVLIDAVNMMLWLYRRLPRAYERPPFVEKSIADLANIVGVEVSEYFTERGAARAPGNTQRPKDE